jgi:hypothetical protein
MRWLSWNNSRTFVVEHQRPNCLGNYVKLPVSSLEGLMPHTRRVRRAFDQGENTAIAVADIEQGYRAGLLGGNDPTVFRPERW